MTYQQPNVAPEGCKNPRCVYLEEIRTSSGVQRDRCLNGIPQHEGCAWKVSIEEIRKSV